VLVNKAPSVSPSLPRSRRLRNRPFEGDPVSRLARSRAAPPELTPSG
jgi:hypothetical protein